MDDWMKNTGLEQITCSTGEAKNGFHVAHNARQGAKNNHFVNLDWLFLVAAGVVLRFSKS